MTALERDILNILSEDARIPVKKIAAMLSVDETQVKDCISQMENNGLLVKYTAIINSEKADDSLVEALIEVKVTPKKKEGFDGIARICLCSRHRPDLDRHRPCSGLCHQLDF